VANPGHPAIRSTEPLTGRLAAILCRPVGKEERSRAVRHVRDWSACSALGARSEAGLALARYAERQPRGDCIALGAGRRTAEAAAFMNGGLGNIYEMDDVHRMAVIHPGDSVLPAALAAAEREGCDGKALLDAIVRGYEAAIRIGTAAGSGHYRYWYNTATCGVFGAAAAVASILNLDAARTAQALANAGMQFAGVWQCRMEPSFGKQLATAHAARSGLVSADLAAVGFTGPLSVLEGSHGFLAATGADGSPEAVGGEPDAPWKIWETSFKPWPSCRVTHPVIEAAMRARAAIDPSAIAGIEIATFQQAVDLCDQPAPKTPHEGRFSLQHCAAIALLAGVPELIHFEPRWLDDPRVVALRAKVAVRARADMTRAFPASQGVSLKVDMGSGVPLVIDLPAAKGDPENPMTEDELAAKARTLFAAAAVGEKDMERLLAAIAALEDDGAVADFAAALESAVAPTPFHHTSEARAHATLLG